MQGSRFSLFALGPVLALVPVSVYAALWTDLASPPALTQTVSVELAGKPGDSADFKHRLLSADPASLRQQFIQAAATRAHAKSSAGAGVAASVDLPMPDGSMRSYTVEDSPVMAAELAEQFPEIKTFKLRAVDSPALSGRVSITPLGFHGYLDTENGTVYIDPVRGSHAQRYRAYYKLDYALAHKDSMQPFSCGVHASADAEAGLISNDTTAANTAAKTAAKTDDALRNYDIAVAATGQYSVEVARPGTADKATTQAEIVNAINRVNQIYERDLGVHLNLIMDDRIIYLDGKSDPYTNDDSTALLDENQNNLSTINPPINYDIGHVFSTGGGGLASLGVVCDSASKARGETGLSDPTGDPFYIDYVAHEIGHQFNAEHTFNGTTGSCGGNNRKPATAYEPGSGSTVMAYAGICGAENIASQADAVFHANSIERISTFTRTGSAAACSEAGVNSGNLAPAVTVASTYTIPGGSYFELSGSATDTDSLVYHWDELDAGLATDSASLGQDLGSNALFRSYAPSATGNNRSFPALANILNGSTTLGETLPMESRTLHFRLTASDDKGGVNSADTQVVVDGSKGPFRVLQPDSNLVLASGPQVIEWNAACSELAPVSCANVDILYSDDGGSNFSTLLASTANDGEETVSLPMGNTSQARIKIKCSDNIFFDISDTSFTVSSIAGSVLASTGNGGSYNCGTRTLVDTSGGGGAVGLAGLLMLLFSRIRLARRKSA